MRHRILLLVAVVAALLVPIAPATSVPTPVVAKNLELLANIPDPGAISGAFDSTRPLFYVNTTQGVSIYDTSNPALPTLKTMLPLPHFENERMNLGERGETKFLLLGLDTHAVTPTKDPNKPNFGGYEVVIVDVTNAAAPFIRSRIKTATSAHTVHCIDTGCMHVYTAGVYDNGFSILDLTDLDMPRQVRAVVKSAAVSGHQWDVDKAGIFWHTGEKGGGAYDVTDPLNPVLLAATTADGISSANNPYNNFILHNSHRPNAKAFKQTPGPDGRLNSGPPSVQNGNVLLVTEEDYDSPVCGGGAGEGMFSTWYIPYLDAAQYAAEPGAGTPGSGKIAPLSTWNTEILDSGQKTVAGAFCSAHYFTLNDDGFVAQAWYQQGTRILDVRDPMHIKQVGYFFTGHNETWIPYFVPDRDPFGRLTGLTSDLIYTADVVRGIDVLKFTPPGTSPAATVGLEAPILPQWLAASSGAVPVRSSAPTKAYGFACRLPEAVRPTVAFP